MLLKTVQPTKTRSLVTAGSMQKRLLIGQLSKKLGNQLKGELESNPDLRNLLTDPEAGVSTLFASMTDCKVTF